MITEKQLDHPYMREYMEVPLMLHKLKLECLLKKLALMPLGETEYEKNDFLLEKIRINGEVKALQLLINEREAYYIHYWNKEFMPAITDFENNYESVVLKGRELAKESDEIRDMLAKVEFVPIGSVNIEGKLMNFKMLKNLIKQHLNII